MGRGHGSGRCGVREGGREPPARPAGPDAGHGRRTRRVAPGAAGMRARAAGLQHARLGHRCVAIGCRFGWFGFFFPF